jgi:phosphohistidine phosphatase
MRKHLRTLPLEPELVLCSAAVRTRETLELMQLALSDARVTVEEQLYGASSDDLLDRIRLVPDAVGSLMLIGHNPALHELALDLASTGDELPRLETKFPTGALATLAVAGPWKQLAAGSAVLEAFVVPRQLS